jgi:exodeoxyribonuclease V alpha subunit
MKKKSIKISGEIIKISFRNSESWSVFTIKNTSTSGPTVPTATTNCTGILAEMCEVGSEVTCTGTMESSQYGKQLRCEQIVPAAPDVSNDQGVVKLLQRLPGIGPKKAMQAVQKFGHVEAWKLACSDPEQIGVKPADKDEAMAVAATLLESYEATVYLLGIGLTDHQASTIYRQYGKDTVKMVSENPYSLTEIDGFGFLTVDKIALKSGVSVGNPARIAACVLYVLADSATNGGNIWFNGWSLVDMVIETLTQTAIRAEVPMQGAPDTQSVRQQVHFLAAEEKLTVSEGRVFSRSLLEAEQSIYDFIGGAA